MRKALLTPLLLTLSLTACSGSGGGGGTDSGTDTEGTGGTTGSGTDTAGSTGSTGGDNGLVPCDPLMADSCETGTCAGETSNGYYCRLPCSSMAGVGDPCGSGGVCLRATENDPDTLACFELQDCDFMTGEGCNLAGGESCVVIDQDPLRTACVPNGNTGNGMSCTPNGMHQCDVGLACLGADLDAMSADDGRCTAWCIPGQELPADCSMCVELTPEIGSCAECSLIDNDCPAGEQCQPINENLGGVCVGFGPGGQDDPCNPIDPAQSCLDGFVCIEIEEDNWECVEKCDPNNPMCMDTETTCADIGLLNPNYPQGELGFCGDFGTQFCVPDGMPTGCSMGDLCIEIEMGLGFCAAPCDPTSGDAACMGNYACFPTNDMDMFNLDPFVAGNGACGDSCMGDGDCGGGTCLLTDGLEAPGFCGTTCTPGNPTECAGNESCVPTPGDPQVGSCVLIGTSCDPTDVQSCLGTGATCVALDGMPTAGTCVPLCFLQDPAACVGASGTCSVKTDPNYHSGGCIGQDLPCDAANQTGCMTGETCDALGGSAFGGTAFICGDSGASPEGTDCSMDDDICAEGLLCYQDACRAYCDPGNDQCVTGSCMDLSAQLYLPVSTVGACI